MHIKNNVVALVLFIPLFLFGCDQGSVPAKTAETPAPVAPAAAMQQNDHTTQTNKGELVTLSGGGKVVTTISTETYVFMELENEGERSWVTTISIEIKEGDRVDYKNGQVMSGFYSKNLDKTFEKIVFVDTVSVNGQIPKLIAPPRTVPGAAGGSPHVPGLGDSASKAPVKIEMGSIKKINGGYTVEELIQKRDELNGKFIKVRGSVVKFLPGIMGKNWIHLQDGTGKEGSNDLTITTQDQTSVGSIINISGKLAANKDFGGGYSYSVIVEDATVSINN